ncbi:Serine/threonine-protein kinase STY46 [Balamuthia mandrillaris]
MMFKEDPIQHLRKSLGGHKRAASSSTTPKQGRLTSSSGTSSGEGIDLKQTKAINELKSLLDSEEDYRQLLLNRSAEFPTLLRFLKAEKGNVKKAADRLRAHMKWWQHQRPDNIMSRDIKDSLWFSRGIGTFGGFDKAGRPCIIIFPALHAPPLSKQEIETVAFWVIERLLRTMIEGVYQFNILLDFTSCICTKDYLTSVSTMVDLCIMLRRHYPCSLANIFILNPTTLWSVFLRTILHATGLSNKDLTRKIIVIREEVVRERLLEYFDRDQLPIEYGGTAHFLTDQQSSLLKVLQRTPSEPRRRKSHDSHTYHKCNEDISSIFLATHSAGESNPRLSYLSRGQRAPLPSTARQSPVNSGQHVTSPEQTLDIRSGSASVVGAELTLNSHAPDKIPLRSSAPHSKRNSREGRDGRGGRASPPPSSSPKPTTQTGSRSLTALVSPKNSGTLPSARPVRPLTVCSVNPKVEERARYAWEIDYKELDILEQIGAGGMGIVYKAKFRGTTVAVKKLNTTGHPTRSEFKRFLREIDIMSKLRHPNILLLMGACLEYPNICVITEYISEGDVLRYIKKKRRSFLRKLEIAIDAARGMLFLHLRNPPCLHQDLKASNLLVDRSGRVKVGDFGIAQVQEELMTLDGEQPGEASASKAMLKLSTPNQCFGTLNWLPPEVLNAEQRSKEADVWSFGMVLWELLSEQVPFQDMSQLEIILAIMENKMPSFPTDDCPPEYAELIRDCWQPQPEERPSFQEILTRLEALQQRLKMVDDSRRETFPPHFPSVVASTSAAASAKEVRRSSMPSPQRPPLMAPLPSFGNSKSSPRLISSNDGKEQELQKWLHDLDPRFVKYAKHFLSQEVYLESALKLTSAELIELGLPLGVRKKILEHNQQRLSLSDVDKSEDDDEGEGGFVSKEVELNESGEVSFLALASSSSEDEKREDSDENNYADLQGLKHKPSASSRTNFYGGYADVAPPSASISSRTNSYANTSSPSTSSSRSSYNYYASYSTSGEEASHVVALDSDDDDDSEDDEKEVDLEKLNFQSRVKLSYGDIGAVSAPTSPSSFLSLDSDDDEADSEAELQRKAEAKPKPKPKVRTTKIVGYAAESVSSFSYGDATTTAAVQNEIDLDEEEGEEEAKQKEENEESEVKEEPGWTIIKKTSARSGTVIISRGDEAGMVMPRSPSADNKQQQAKAIEANGSKILERVNSARLFLPYRQIKHKELKWREKIGSGAFGAVYKGTWRGSAVAIKKLDVYLDDEAMAEFKREASLMHLLGNHPNIVSFVGAATNQEEGTPCLVTQFCRNGSLYDLLCKKQTKLPWVTMVKMARDASSGLLHLHAEGVIHRDIAARNVLVGDNYNVYISDFGLSRVKKAAHSANRTQSTIGPIKYMAPEAIRCREYSEKSDAFSFGILLWEMWTRSKEPFPELPPAAVAQKVAYEGLRLSIPEDCDPTWKKLMLSCWNEDPALRPDFRTINKILRQQFKQLNVLYPPNNS